MAGSTSFPTPTPDARSLRLLDRLLNSSPIAVQTGSPNPNDAAVASDQSWGCGTSPGTLDPLGGISVLLILVWRFENRRDVTAPPDPLRTDPGPATLPALF